MSRHPAHDKLVGENVYDVGRIQPRRYTDRDGFTRKFINDVQYPDLPSVMGSVLDKIISPDVIWPLRTETDA
jgi:hypothetical protein